MTFPGSHGPHANTGQSLSTLQGMASSRGLLGGGFVVIAGGDSTRCAVGKPRGTLFDGSISCGAFRSVQPQLETIAMTNTCKRCRIGQIFIPETLFGLTTIGQVCRSIPCQVCSDILSCTDRASTSFDIINEDQTRWMGKNAPYGICMFVMTSS